MKSAKENECSGTVMYLNAISDGHVQYLSEKAKQLRKKDDEESNQAARILTKKIKAEKVAEMD